MVFDKLKIVIETIAPTTIISNIIKIKLDIRSKIKKFKIVPQIIK
jgi:hypothetical protein